MLLYYLKCINNIESKNTKVMKTPIGRIMSLSNCAVCYSKKLRFIKEHKASGLLSNLGIKTPLSKIPVVALLLF